MKSPSIDQKSFQASTSSFVSVGWDLSECPWSSSLRSSLLSVCSRLRVGSRNSWSLPDNFTVPSANGNIECSLLCGVITAFAFTLRAWISDASKIFQLLNVCNHNISFPNSPCDQYISEEYSRYNFLTELVEPGLVSRRNRMIFNCTKRHYWSFEWFSESPFVKCFPIWQEVLQNSQVSVTFRGPSQPCFIQARSRQYSRRPFLILRTALSAIPSVFRSVRCWCTMIPW